MTIANAITPSGRNLPAELPGQAQRVGYVILRALDRLGFVHERKDGEIFTIRFADVSIYDRRWAAYQIDTERLYHFSIPDLASPRVVSTLSAATRLPIRTLSRGGFFYVADLYPSVQPAPKLPPKVLLDLSRRPDDPLAAPIGEGAYGAVWRTLPELGHVMIAGATGSGKSTWLHAALGALFSGAGVDRLRAALIDPKRSELAIWAACPHVIGEVACDKAQAAQLLSGVVQEINRRGDLFVQAGVREIKAYNRQAAEPLPAILCVIDEALDLVLGAGARSDLVDQIKTVAMRGRSTGVYLWLATQHAAAVTGLPRVAGVNLVTRLVFRVADRSAAQVAGCPGAERISQDRPGRLLARLGGDPQEIQSYYLPDKQLADLAHSVWDGSKVGPSLTEGERAMVAFAVSQLGGAFIKNKLVAAFPDWTDHRVKKLAKSWEIRGWLTQPAHRAAPRRVTPELARWAGVELPPV